MFTSAGPLRPGPGSQQQRQYRQIQHFVSTVIDSPKVKGGNSVT